MLIVLINSSAYYLFTSPDFETWAGLWDEDKPGSEDLNQGRRLGTTPYVWKEGTSTDQFYSETLNIMKAYQISTAASSMRISFSGVALRISR